MRNMLQRGRIVLSWLLMGVMVLTFAGIVAPVLPQWPAPGTNLLQRPLSLGYQPGLRLLAGQTAQKESPEIYFPAGTAHRAL